MFRGNKNELYKLVIPITLFLDRLSIFFWYKNKQQLLQYIIKKINICYLALRIVMMPRWQVVSIHCGMAAGKSNQTAFSMLLQIKRGNEGRESISQVIEESGFFALCQERFQNGAGKDAGWYAGKQQHRQIEDRRSTLQKE